MQSYTEINETELLENSRALLLANDKTALSCSSGTAFPTTNLQQGQFCFRADELKLYQLVDAGLPTWTLVMDFNKTALHVEDADALYAAISHQHSVSEITDAGTAASKDVGTTSGTVAAGDHTHTDLYEAKNTDILKADESDTLTVGMLGQSVNLGTITVGVNLSIAAGNVQHGVLAGDATFTAPTDANEGYIEIELTVDATGGYAPIFTGFNQISGNIDTTASAVNLLRISKMNTNTYLEITQAV